MSTIAVDFDGVIHAYTKGWQDGSIYDEPMPGTFDALRQLMTRHAVFVHTSRNPEQVATWLIGHGMPCRVGYDGEFWNDQSSLLVTDRKLPALAYIDDRGVRFIDWDQALGALADLGLWRP